MLTVHINHDEYPNQESQNRSHDICQGFTIKQLG